MVMMEEEDAYITSVFTRNYRMRGIGKSMVAFAMEALKKEEINKVSLIAFTKNDIGNGILERNCMDEERRS